MRFLFTLLLAISLTANAAQQPPLALDQCIDQAPFGFPTLKKENVSSICRDGHFIVYDNSAKIPAFASYVLTPEKAVGCLERTNSFATDQSLQKSSASTIKDYAKSGYDKGHMVNSGDMRWSIQAEEDSFILSNMAPQLPGFNRGIWKELEDATRAWSINRKSPILIYVGPIYNKYQDSTIGKGLVTVPHAFYKILIDINTREMLVFYFLHESSSEPLDKFITSLAQVQKETGITFSVPKDVKSTELWQMITKSGRRAKELACKN